ncbi:helix-turn-helix domain-containing protein [Sulfurospirillum deleyianum]|uniref:Helix-turn-helix domain-containing protein n=1 Tax=Sulfurospirillum deleyianum (strain ATCC 51133 / DSM 6946 / 5175) TaxID=525898 RepID=D1B4J1_SULD5|nr:helix-turn-helix domain-containing protein [Sulfurospirillum deleyianum]ACZ13011.1 hypothetical protein Sdel_1996 [Sulfurospirillum deleyianum DSM 6946]
MNQFLTQKEAAEFLKISDETLKRYKQKGALVCGVHFFKREGIVRFDSEQLTRWLKGENSINVSSAVDRILASI